MKLKLVVSQCLLVFFLILSACGSNSSVPSNSSPTPAASSEAGAESPGGATAEAEDFKGQTLIVQVWGGAYEETMRSYVIPEFEEETGAKVELVLGDSPVAKLKAEGDKPSVDVMHMAASAAASAIEMDVLAPIQVDTLVNGPDLYPSAVESDYTVATNWGSFGISYLKDAVQTPPADWKDLWNPEYKGKVIIWDIENSGTIELMDMIARDMGSTITDESVWDDVFAKMQELKPNIAAFVKSHAEVETMLVSGQATIAVQPNGRAIRMIRDGVPIEFVSPASGSPTVTSLVGIAAKTSKKALAEKFVDTLLGTTAQAAYAEHNFYAPTNAKTTVPEDLQPLMPYGQEKVEALVMIDHTKLAPLKSALIERWNLEMK